MSSGSTAGAVGGKAARACDSCLRRRARWYCAADDAFLCQACDASVHSANPLARRHERLRLRPTSPPLDEAAAASMTSAKQGAPAWSRRKARSRRPHVKSVAQLLSSRTKVVVVPEVAAEESEEEEQLLYHRVPSFDRAHAELCSPAAAASSCRDSVDGAVENASNKHQDHPPAATTSSSPVQQQLLPGGGLAGFGPTDAELREFAADMEALLGQGMDDGNESFYMESLGLMPSPASEDDDDGGRVKTDPDAVAISKGDVLKKEFNDDEDGFEEKAAASKGGHAADAQFLRRSLDLRLDYEAVIESWGTSPWTDGQRPHVRPDDLWPHHHAYHRSGAWPAGEGGPLLPPRWGAADGCREARVSRYREKRRTRLFAKKIRYEVRKLNAEKRPRMKGRFVKRPSAAAAPCAAVTT